MRIPSLVPMASPLLPFVWGLPPLLVADLRSRPCLRSSSGAGAASSPGLVVLSPMQAVELFVDQKENNNNGDGKELEAIDFQVGNWLAA